MLRRSIVLCAIFAALGGVSPDANASGATPADARVKTSESVPAPTKVVDLKDATTTSEFSERLMLLEFADRNDPKCAQTVGLVNEMRRKNYPIQRVEPNREGAELFREYRVDRLPAYVFLVDGREYDRFVVQNERVDQIRVKLMTMFVKGKAEISRRPSLRLAEPRRAFFGLIPRSSTPSGVMIRAQASDTKRRTKDDSESESEQDANDSKSNSKGTGGARARIPEDRIMELSDAIGRTRLEAATADVYATSADEKIEREGMGVAIHFNAEFQEVLFVVSSRLFKGIDVDKEPPKVYVNVYSPLENSSEESVGQCVYNDPETGIAFVAARVSHPTAPVAFLPKQAPMKVGEEAYEYARSGENLAVVAHEVLAVDQRRFYQREETAENRSVVYDQLADKPRAEGTGCFVRRNGRLYFAGLCSFGDSPDECVVTPTSVLLQALLANRNLSTVYRDQLAGKFDVSASQQEIDFVLNLLDEKDSPRDATARTAKKQTPDQILDEKELAQNRDDESDSDREESVLTRAESESDPETIASSALNDSFQIDLDETVADAATEGDEIAESTHVSEEQTQPSNPKTSAKARTTSTLDAQTAVVHPSVALDPQYMKVQPSPTQPGAPTAQAETAPAQNVAQPATPTQASAQPAAPTPTQAIEAPAAQIARIQQVASSAPTNESPATQATGAVLAPVEAASAAKPEPTAPIVAWQQAIPQYVAPQIPFIFTTQTPDGQTIQYMLAPIQTLNNGQLQQTYATALPPLINVAPNETRLVGYEEGPDPETVAAFEREEEEFNAALDTLRRSALEGAEIVCIVNRNGDAKGEEPKESEVVRLPRRTIADPTAPRSKVELAETPGLPEEPIPPAPRQSSYIPLTASAGVNGGIK